MATTNRQPGHRPVDRRSGEDRRQVYSIDYFLNGGVERRKNPLGDRRANMPDRRKTRTR